MSVLLQQVVDGIGAGAIYAAFALALVLIYRATRIVNFGQGEMATFCAYLAWQLHDWGLPIPAALVIGAVASFCIGALSFKAFVRPVLNASSQESVVVVTLGLFIAYQAASLWLWGSDGRTFPRLFFTGGWRIGSIRITPDLLGILVVLGLVSLGLAALFRLTRLGLAMRAAAAEREKSILVGIRVETMLTLGWGLAAVVGFLAAVLVAPQLFLSPSMMVSVLIYGLAAATVGGWDSPIGAVIGGLVIGVVESVGAARLSFIGVELRLAIPIALTFLVLMMRPAGLFGRKAMVRV